MVKQNEPPDKTADLNEITPEVDELCSILAQAVERITKNKLAKNRKQP